VAVNVTAIDPGVAGAGNACAASEDKRIVCVWFARVPRFERGALLGELEGPCADIVIVERPVLQGDRTRAARPQDLMSLAWEGALLAGAYAGRDGATLIELPANDTRDARGWKGSEPKPVQHARLWAILDAGERALLGGLVTERVIYAAREKGALNRWGRPGASYYPRAFTTHNLLDACALNATYTGRLRRTA